MPATTLAQPEKSLTNKTGTARVHNPTKVDRVVEIGGVKYGFRAGKSRSLDFHDARFAADQLVNQILIEEWQKDKKTAKDGVRIRSYGSRLNDQRLRTQLIKDILLYDEAGSIFEDYGDDLSDADFGEEEKEKKEVKTKTKNGKKS